MNNQCPSSKSGFHYFTPFQVRADFEATQFGMTAAETDYRRVEYNYAACGCGAMKKTKVIPEGEGS